jgi:hypothetical protein
VRGPLSERRIAEPDPRALCCTADGAMLGDGVVWVRRSGDGYVVSARRL